jgi:hypothetical protein
MVWYLNVEPTKVSSPSLSNEKYSADACLFVVVTSVADPEDKYVFGPPGSGSGSVSKMYRSGSFYHQVKLIIKPLIPTVLLTSIWIFIFEK